MSLNYSFITERGRQGVTREQVTLIVPGRRDPLVADNTHPAWDKIKAGIEADDPKVVDLFNLAQSFGSKLRHRVSERVTVDHNTLYFDGDPVDGALSQHIVAVAGAHLTGEAPDEEFEQTVGPLVALFENIAANPSKNSREQMFNYIRRNGITTTQDGYLVLYKYLMNGGEEGLYLSGHAGPAIINGQPHTNGKVPQRLGDIIEMPRSQVADNPNAACSSGLHVGAWSYVGGYGNVRCEIHVHPRDVVSVPYDANERKIRVCRYRLVRVLEGPYEKPVTTEWADPAPTTDQAIATPQEAPESPVEAPVAAPDPRAKVKHPKRADFLALQAKSKTRRRPVRSLVAESKTINWTLLEGCDGTKREHWAV